MAWGYDEQQRRPSPANGRHEDGPSKRPPRQGRKDGHGGQQGQRHHGPFRDAQAISPGHGQGGAPASVTPGHDASAKKEPGTVQRYESSTRKGWSQRAGKKGRRKRWASEPRDTYQQEVVAKDALGCPATAGDPLSVDSVTPHDTRQKSEKSAHDAQGAPSGWRQNSDGASEGGWARGHGSGKESARRRRRKHGHSRDVARPPVQKGSVAVADGKGIGRENAAKNARAHEELNSGLSKEDVAGQVTTAPTAKDESIASPPAETRHGASQRIAAVIGSGPCADQSNDAGEEAEEEEEVAATGDAHVQWEEGKGDVGAVARVSHGDDDDDNNKNNNNNDDDDDDDDDDYDGDGDGRDNDDRHLEHDDTGEGESYEDEYDNASAVDESDDDAPCDHDVETGVLFPVRVDVTCPRLVHYLRSQPLSVPRLMAFGLVLEPTCRVPVVAVVSDAEDAVFSFVVLFRKWAEYINALVWRLLDGVRCSPYFEGPYGCFEAAIGMDVELHCPVASLRRDWKALEKRLVKVIPSLAHAVTPWTIDKSRPRVPIIRFTRAAAYAAFIHQAGVWTKEGSFQGLRCPLADANIRFHIVARQESIVCIRLPAWDPTYTPVLHSMYHLRSDLRPEKGSYPLIFAGFPGAFNTHLLQAYLDDHKDVLGFVRVVLKREQHDSEWQSWGIMYFFHARDRSRVMQMKISFGGVRLAFKIDGEE